MPTHVLHYLKENCTFVQKCILVFILKSKTTVPMGQYKKVLPSSVKFPCSSQGKPALDTEALKVSQHNRVDL